MLVIIATICAINAPDQCGEARLQFAEETSILACLRQAPPYLAQYVVEHPNIRVAKWRCAYPEREGDPA